MGIPAEYEWDSAGHSVKTTYTAEAKVPKPVKVKGVNMPQQDGSYKWSEYKGYKDENDTTPMRVKYLEFPMDMEFFKVALDYDKSIGGVLILLTYNIDDDEPLNTTLNNMFKGFAKKDSMGYRGISVHNPLENTVKGGYSENSSIAGIHMLDTLYGTGMMLPLGEFYMDFYSTDSAYIDYVDKVKASEDDSRPRPVSTFLWKATAFPLGMWPTGTAPTRAATIPTAGTPRPADFTKMCSALVSISGTTYSRPMLRPTSTTLIPFPITAWKLATLPRSKRP